MTSLESFSKDQRDLLIALPYRVGVWLSECDDKGGHQANDAEINALEIVIRSYAEDFCKSEFVESIMRETIASKSNWGQWRDNTKGVPDECSRAIDLLAERIEQKHVSSFKQNLMDIANTVALAHREFDEHGMSFSDRIWVLSRYIRGRIKGAFTKQPFPSIDEIMSISRTEDVALQNLSAALRLGKQEGLPDRDPYDGVAAA